MAMTLANPPAAQLITEVVRDIHQWDQLREQWQRLHVTAAAAAPLDFDWLRAWWDIYGRAYASRLFILIARRQDELVAALPLYVRKASKGGGMRTLAFIGTGEREREELCPDYLDVLCAPGDEDAAHALLESLVEEHWHCFDRLELSDVGSDARAANWARRCLAQRELEIVPRGACPVAELTGGFEAYLARLSANQRQHSRRLLRQAAAAGLRLEVATPQTFETFFHELVDLHQNRWIAAGQPGCFSAPRFTAFHRRLAQQWVGEGKALLTRLRHGEQTLAVKYGFIHDHRYAFYQSGVAADGDEAIKSPGNISFLMLMEHLAQRGITELDFLRGDSAYKQRLATTNRPLLQVRWVRWTWRSQVGCATGLACRGAHRLMKLLRRGNCGQGWAKGG
jgi:CelD/BcsL family acetyltransferase involved in cellulose biosynthesis